MDLIDSFSYRVRGEHVVSHISSCIDRGSNINRGEQDVPLTDLHYFIAELCLFTSA